MVAYHEAGHAILAAHLGLMPEEVGVEVATRFEAGAVVAPAYLSASRTRRAIVLAAGGLAEERVSQIAARGTASDEGQIADLGLSPPAVRAARRRASRLVEDLWPFIEALVPLLLKYRHLAGETAVFVALEAVFGAEEATRRSKLVSLGRAFV